jgi:hypothetical protein
VTIKLPNDPTTYLRVVNGFLALTNGGAMTDRELEIMAFFVQAHKEIREEGLKVHPFHPLVKKRVATLAGRGNYHTLNNYVKVFKDKGLIKPTPDGYRFHPLLEPREQITYVFEEQSRE